MKRLVLIAVLGGCIVPPEEAPPEPVGPPEPIDLAAVADPEPLAALVRWRSSGLEVASGRLDVIALRDQGEVPLESYELGGPPVYDARWVELQDAGTYAFRVELQDAAGQVVGLGRTEPVEIVEPENPLRFLDLEQDLGLSQRIGLRLLLAYPRRAPGSGELDPLEASVRRFSELVLQEAVGPVYPVDVEGLYTVENARDLLLEAEAGVHASLPHALGAQALAVVDLDRSDGRAQLGLRLFDVSYRRYQREQPERRLWNGRVLVFEDHVTLDPVGLAEGRTLQVLLDAWRELLGGLAQDPRARAYRDFVCDESAGASWQPDRQEELLKLLGLELAAEGAPENFEEVEARILFPGTPPAPAVQAGAPAPGGEDLR